MGVGPSNPLLLNATPIACSVRSSSPGPNPVEPKQFRIIEVRHRGRRRLLIPKFSQLDSPLLSEKVSEKASNFALPMHRQALAGARPLDVGEGPLPLCTHPKP